MLKTLRYKTIMIIYLLVLIVTCALRIIQFFSMTDSVTGFAETDMEYSVLFINVLLVLFGVCLIYIGRLTHRKPKVIPYNNPLFSLAPILTMLGLLFNCIHILSSNQLNINFVVDLFGLIGFASVVYSLLIKRIVKKPFAVAISAYMLVRLILSFIYYNGLQHISESNLEIFSICLAAVFIIIYSQCICDINSTSSFKWLLPICLATSYMCFVSAIPKVIAFFIKKPLVHSTSCSFMFIFLLGAFALLSTHCIYNIKNLKSHDSSVNELKIESTSNNDVKFYFND